MLNITKKVNFLMAQLGGLSLGFIILFLLVDVVGRLISQPVSGAGEMAILSMMVAVYSGIPYCEETDNHVNVEAIYNFLPKRKNQWLRMIARVLSLITVALALFAITHFARVAYLEQVAVPGARPIRIFPVTFVMVVSFILYFLQSFVNLKREISLLFPKRK
jgi:TRAP-type C4-dicarboxylate transport system permease small subunit